MLLSATAARAGQPLQQRGGPAATSASRRSEGRRPHPGVPRPVRTQALFGFLAPAKPKSSPSKAQELVSQLLELAERTDGGLNASAAKRQQIEELVEELEGFCPRNPLRSTLLFGDYEVLYASKPETAGGPFRSPLGRAVFPGQRALQSLREPNVCINEVSYKALGFIPGSARQEGEFTPISADTFQIVFPELDGKVKGGPPRRIIQIAYLDDRIRVARAIPPEDNEGAVPSFYVFRRLVEEEAEEEEEEVPKRGALAFGTRKMKAAVQEEQEDAPPARRSMLGTQLLGRKDSLATIAEKRYAQQKGGTGTVGRGTGTVGRGGTGSSATARKTREEVAAERAAARAAVEEERRAAREAAEEERRAAREAAAAAKAAAEEERRARQAQLEAERARVAELKEAARKQLAQLQGEASEAADEAKAAVATAKDAEKSAAAVLKKASEARDLINQVTAAAASALQEVEGLKQQEKVEAAAVTEARGALKKLEMAGRAR